MTKIITDTLSMKNSTVCNVLTNYINSTLSSLSEKIEVTDCIQIFDDTFILKIIKPKKREEKKCKQKKE